MCVCFCVFYLGVEVQALICNYTALPYNNPCMQTIIETPEFIRCAKGLKLSNTELQELIEFLANNPTAGDEIAGTGGARKLRFARSGSGKSGGYRVITFYSGKSIPLFLLSIFSKNQKVNLSQSERNTLKRVLKLMLNHYKKSEVL